MKIAYETYELRFRHPFGISRGTKTFQPIFLVKMEHLGHSAYGEAPAIGYYDITLERMKNDLEGKKAFVEKFAFTEPGRWWHYLHHLFPSNPFLVCALDMAGWDLYGKMKGEELKSFWMPANPFNPVCDYTIGIDTPEKMLEKMKEKPWPVYKIKLGTTDDTGIIEYLRAHTSSVFRVDANAAWEAGEALEKIRLFASMNVEFVEQPLAKDDWEGMKWLFSKSPLPLIADESCVAENDVEKCNGHFHGINIKLTKCSGITPALRMIRRAREAGMQIMIGSMNESTVGSAAIAQLVPLADHIDADGPMLLQQDIATGLEYSVDGHIKTSGKPGLGIMFSGLYNK